MTYEATRRVETSARTFAIVEHLAHAGPTRVSALARDLEMSKGIVHNHLSTLRELGYVVKRGAHYLLSARFVHLGRRVRSHSPLYRAASGAVAAYADRHEVGVLLLEDAGADGVVIESDRLPPAVDLTVGTTSPLSQSLPGRVLLESQRESDRESSDTGIDRQASDTGIDRQASETNEGSAETGRGTGDPAREPDDPTRGADDVGQQLAERGFAVGALSAADAVRCVAVPIHDDEGTCYGCVAVVLPDGAETTREGAVVESVSALAAEIEGHLEDEDAAERSVTTAKHAWIE
jgi:DNA-binding IclR family transcriptional regulator